MKILSQVSLLVLAVAALTACESGKGPSKPAGTSSAQTMMK